MSRVLLQVENITNRNGWKSWKCCMISEFQNSFSGII